MIRTLITIAFASFILAVACLAGAAALGGRDIAENGWTIPSEWQYRISERQGRNRVERVRPSETITRELPWNGGESLVLDLPVDVTYVQGAEARVVVEGPKDYAERITLEGGRFGLAGDVQIDSSDVTIDLNGVRVLDARVQLRDGALEDPGVDRDGAALGLAREHVERVVRRLLLAHQS
jgi:hypothetical protein